MPSESPEGAVATISTRFLDDSLRVEESIRLLRPGTDASTLLFRHEFRPSGCPRAQALSWRDDVLVYWTTEGRVVVLEADSGDHVDLTAAVARLPGGFQSAGWR